MRPELTRLLDHMTVRGRIWMGVEVRRLLVADLGELEGEENAVSPALCDGFAHACHDATGGAVLGVLAVEQIRIDLGLGGELLVILQLAHHRRELFGRQRSDLALVMRLERLRALEGVGQRLLDGGIGWRLEEIRQIPANILRAGFFRRLCHGTVRITASSVRF